MTNVLCFLLIICYPQRMEVGGMDHHAYLIALAVAIIASIVIAKRVAMIRTKKEKEYWESLKRSENAWRMRVYEHCLQDHPELRDQGWR